MASKTHKFYDMGFCINPYEQKVILYMTLHSPLIIACQMMRLIS